MKDFHVCNELLEYVPFKISVILVISLKHNIIFAKFFQILLENNAVSLRTYALGQSNNNCEVI